MSEDEDDTAIISQSAGRFPKCETPAAPLSVAQIHLHGNIEYKEIQCTSTSKDVRKSCWPLPWDTGWMQYVIPIAFHTYLGQLIFVSLLHVMLPSLYNNDPVTHNCAMLWSHMCITTHKGVLHLAVDRNATTNNHVARTLRIRTQLYPQEAAKFIEVAWCLIFHSHQIQRCNLQCPLITVH